MARASQHPADQMRREFQRRRRLAAAELATGDLPRYTYEQLRSSLRDGALAVEDRLVEEQLVQSFAATRHSVRRALQDLADDGLVSRERRLGTSVSGTITGFPAGAVWPCGPDDDPVPGLQVVLVDHRVITAPPVLAARMATKGARLFVMEQLGVLGGVNLYSRIGYTPEPPDCAAYLAELTRLEAAPCSVPEAFAALFGRPYGSGTVHVQAVPAQPDLARKLGIEADSPVLLREMLLLDDEGTPRELSYTSFRGSHVTVTSADQNARRFSRKVSNS